ncbi:ABC transporter permease [Arcanobacterium phocae]|uniref:ABC transporter permease n=1 Tax=Arcanobacterium phocae TaxID=131112 RepID=UPI001C0ED063|nr:FtsX-like permease family protein [Arcanobacterium phocae]
MVILLSTVMIFIGLAGQEYIEQSQSHSARSSLTNADIIVYNDEIPGHEFLTDVERLPQVRSAHSPTPLWGTVMSASGAAHLNILNVPPKSLRNEDFHEGTYPTATDEIALPVDIATSLEVTVGDEVLLTIPSVGKHGTLRKMTVRGLYSYSPLNENFQSLFNAIAGLDMRELWENIDGKLPIDAMGVYVFKKSGVTLEDLKESLLSIPGTIVITREQTYEQILAETQLYITNLLGPGHGILFLPALGTLLTLYFTGRKILRSRTDDYRLLITMGATQSHIFLLASLQLILVGILTVAAGILLGHISGKVLHVLLQLIPGSRFLSPYYHPSLFTSIQAILVMLGILCLAAIPCAWQITGSPLFYDNKSNIEASTLKFATRRLAGIVIMTTLLVFSAVASRQETDFSQWTSYLAAGALVTIAFFCALVLLGQQIIHTVFRQQLSQSRTSLTRCAIVKRADISDTYRNSFFSSRLIVLGVGMLVVLVSTHVSSSHVLEHIADKINPFDVSVVSDKNSGTGLNDSVINSAIKQPGVASHLSVYNAEIAALMPDSPEDSINLEVRGFTRSDAERYFSEDGGENKDIPRQGSILMPRDVMLNLGVSEGDSLSVTGDTNEVHHLDILESSGPWIVMELSDLQSLHSATMISELWLRANATKLYDFSAFFIDFRTSLVTDNLTDDFRVDAGVTQDVLATAERANWAIPMLSFLVSYVLIAAISARLLLTAFQHEQQYYDTRLLLSLGVSSTSIKRNYLTESLGLVVIDTSIGIVLGIVVTPIIWTYILGVHYHETLRIPIFSIATLFFIIISFTLLFLYMRSLIRKPQRLR